MAEEQNKTGPRNDPKRAEGSTTQPKWVRHFLIGIDKDDRSLRVVNVQYASKWDDRIVHDVHGYYLGLMLLQVDETGAWVWSRVRVTHEVLLTAA